MVVENRGMPPVSNKDMYWVKGTQYRYTTQQQYKHKRSIVSRYINFSNGVIASWVITMKTYGWIVSCFKCGNSIFLLYRKHTIKGNYYLYRKCKIKKIVDGTFKINLIELKRHNHLIISVCSELCFSSC